MKKKLIEFTNFHFKYYSQQEPTLSNINLTIYEGEKILILGESGSGKSTLCNSINGLVPFFYKGTISGSLKINNQETKNLSIFEISKVVGTVLQDPDSQFISLTSGEDIAFKLENMCVSTDKMHEKVNEISKLVDMQNFLNYNPQNLSGGQKQRITIAGSIIDDSQIILFDEPLANLDPKSSNSTIELIDNIKTQKNKTIIIVEHRLEDVLYKHIDRIILMHEGKIVYDSPTNKILSENILTKFGIREPLYVTALKYAQIPITNSLNLENVKNLNLNLIKSPLNNWYTNSDTQKYIRKSTKSILELKNISFSYDSKKYAIQNISFKVFDKEILCIVGKNGAGKSTVSKIICGFIKQTTGEILYNNIDISNYSIKQRGNIVGYVMQNPNQMISHTIVYDEIIYGLKNLNLQKDEIDKRAFEILKICGLYEIRNWPISALSFGQKKRVTIASILITNPKILILDEPTSGQDFKHYNSIMEFILKLRDSGITIILITHDMHLLLEYADRCIVFFDGEKIGDDFPEKILSDENIIKKANLKKTSLYNLAVQCSINNIEDFINKFIAKDRSMRNK